MFDHLLKQVGIPGGGPRQFLYTATDKDPASGDMFSEARGSAG